MRSKAGSDPFSLGDPDETVDRIVRFLRTHSERIGARHLVVGMSGGLDSSVTAALCAKALGGKRTLGLCLPEAETRSLRSIQDAGEVAGKFGISFKTLDMTSLVQAASNLLHSSKKKDSVVPYGNLKARLRAMILYYFANTDKGLVVGTGDKSEIMLGYFCYDEKTRVVTRDGLKGRSELKPGDLVFSLDLKTHGIVEIPVQKLYEFDYSGEMYHFQSQNGDLLVTPNHKMLTERPNGRIVFRTAQESSRHRRILMPLPHEWNGDPSLPLTIPFDVNQKHTKRTISVSIPDIFYMAGLFIGDGSVSQGSISIPVKSQMTRDEYIALPRDVRGQFVSLVQLSPRAETYETYETNFALSSYAKPEIRTKLVRILEKYAIGYSQSRDLIRISSKTIHDFFAQFGIGARNKHIPTWMLQYDSRTLRSLMTGLKDSDGRHDDSEGAFYTTSEELKNGVVQLLVKLGVIPSVKLRPPRVSRFKGKTIRSTWTYEIYYSLGGAKNKCFDNSRTEIIQYHGKVWCPSVPPFENLLVERNGKYAFCGNTKFGDGACDIQPIADLYKSSVRDLAFHLGLPRRIFSKPSSPELWPGQIAEDELGLPYDKLDSILWRLERWMPPKEISDELGIPLRVVARVRGRWLQSEHKRRPPLAIKLGFRTAGQDLRIPYSL